MKIKKTLSPVIIKDRIYFGFGADKISRCVENVDMFTNEIKTWNMLNEDGQC